MNFMYELEASVMLSASARLSPNVIFAVVVFAPLKSIFRPLAASAMLMLSASMSPTLVMTPSPTSREVKEPAAGVVPPTSPSNAPTNAVEVIDVAALTVPKFAIVVLAKVEFLPKTICSLLLVVTNLR